jgi:hypothetical protein
MNGICYQLSCGCGVGSSWLVSGWIPALRTAPFIHHLDFPNPAPLPHKVGYRDHIKRMNILHNVHYIYILYILYYIYMIIYAYIEYN